MKRTALICLITTKCLNAALAATVTSTSDNGAGSLRAAIANASPGETIRFAVTGAIVLTTGELLINKPLTITGPGPANLAVIRSFAPATPDFRIFKVTSSLDLSGLTISRGRVATDGAGISVTSGNLTLNNCTVIDNIVTDGNGAGLYNGGTVQLNQSTIASNTALGRGGSGVGIYNYFGIVQIDQCTIASNIALGDYGEGVGIFNGYGGRIAVNNSTISGNSCNGFNARGIGIMNNPGGTNFSLAMTNCTISGNLATGTSSDGGGIRNNYGALLLDGCTITTNSTSNGGGGIYNHSRSYAILTIRNSLVVGNSAPNSSADIENYDGDFTSAGFNILGIVHAYMSPILYAPSDRTNIAPAAVSLGPLQDNGGPTFTHALLPGSIAIDTGHSGGSVTDQRGGRRKANLPATNAAGSDGSDVGAFEVGGYMQISELRRVNNDIRLDFRTDPGVSYGAERREAWSTGGWTNLPALVLGTGNPGWITETNGALRQQGFYRLRLLP